MISRQRLQSAIHDLCRIMAGLTVCLSAHSSTVFYPALLSLMRMLESLHVGGLNVDEYSSFECCMLSNVKCVAI